LIANPADARELSAWADHVHAGVRTLSRLFLAETGLSFARWRTQVRMRAAVQMLAGGSSGDMVARAVGYHRTSAFITAFRRATGHTPGTLPAGRHSPHRFVDRFVNRLVNRARSGGHEKSGQYDADPPTLIMLATPAIRAATRSGGTPRG